jgi:hypothetical protein
MFWNPVSGCRRLFWSPRAHISDQDARLWEVMVRQDDPLTSPQGHYGMDGNVFSRHPLPPQGHNLYFVYRGSKVFHHSSKAVPLSPGERF